MKLKKINTTKIGDDFENKSLEIIISAVKSGLIGISADCIKIFQKKGYRSHLRDEDIIFDLAIEVWPPGAQQFTLLYLIECKSYSNRVPVNKIEDFLYKISQLLLQNVKPVFISNSPIQKGGRAIAEKVGMMVIQGESVKNYKIILHKSNKDLKSRALPFLRDTVDEQKLKGSEFIERVLDDKIKNAFELINNESRVSYGIEKLSKIDIELTAKSELNKFDPQILIDAKFVDFNKLIKHLQDCYQIEFNRLPSNSNLLGSCDIKNNIISLNPNISGTNRKLFVLVHELGHYILHQKLLIGQTLYDSFEDSKYSFTLNRHSFNNPRHWIEWQANYFACSFILPVEVFWPRLQRAQIGLSLNKGNVFLDDQAQNVKDFLRLIDRLSYEFGVSKTTIIYRLKELELIIDKSRLKSIGEHMHDLYIDL